MTWKAGVQWYLWKSGSASWERRPDGTSWVESRKKFERAAKSGIFVKLSWNSASKNSLMKKIITLLKQEEEDSDDDDDIVFSDYEAAVAGVGDPMAPVRPPTSTTTLPPTTSTLASTSVSSSPVTPESTSTDSVSDIDPRIVNRPAEGEGMDSNNSDEGDFVFPEETTQPPTLGVEPSLGGIDPSLLASPLSLSPCLPLNLLNCGILANPGLTDGLLEFVEAGNIGTDQVTVVYWGAYIECMLGGKGLKYWTAGKWLPWFSPWDGSFCSGSCPGSGQSRRSPGKSQKSHISIVAWIPTRWKEVGWTRETLWEMAVARTRWRSPAGAGRLSTLAWQDWRTKRVSRCLVSMWSRWYLPPGEWVAARRSADRRRGESSTWGDLHQVEVFIRITGNSCSQGQMFNLRGCGLIKGWRCQAWGDNVPPVPRLCKILIQGKIHHLFSLVKRTEQMFHNIKLKLKNSHPGTFWSNAWQWQLWGQRQEQNWQARWPSGWGSTPLT